MVKQLREWLARRREANIGTVANWSKDVAAKHTRVMLEREGLSGFHGIAPRRWPARPLGVQ